MKKFSFSLHARFIALCQNRPRSVLGGPKARAEKRFLAPIFIEDNQVEVRDHEGVSQSVRVIRRILALAVIGVSTVGFNPKILGSGASAYRSLTCGEAVYSLFRDDSGLVTGLIVANLFSDVPITVLVYISTGSPDWRRGKSFTVPAGRIIRIPFRARYPEAEVRVGCSY
jgi:hypothetical protein